MLRRYAGLLALAAVSIGLVLAVFEVGVRLLGYQAIYQVYSKPSVFWRHDELLGWSHEPGSSGTYVGPRPFPIEYETEIRINAAGLRGPEITPTPPGGVRVLFLGDSYVAAFEVAYEDTFTALLETSVSGTLGVPVQVLNAGVRGYGTDQSYLYFRDRGRLLAPDMVVLIHSINDPEDNLTLHRMRRPFGKPALSLGPNGELEPVGTPVPRYPTCSNVVLDDDYQPVRIDGLAARVACGFQTFLADRSALFTFLTFRIRNNPQLIQFFQRLQQGGSSPAKQAGVFPVAAAPPAQRGGQEARYALTTAVIRALAREARAAGAEFVLIVRRTEMDRLDGPSLASSGIRPYSPGGRRLAQSIRFVNDSHLNEIGHRYYDETISPILARELELRLQRRGLR